MKKKKNVELSKLLNLKQILSLNPIAKIVRSSFYSPKMVQSKKLYNRKKERINTLKAAAKKYE